MRSLYVLAALALLAPAAVAQMDVTPPDDTTTAPDQGAPPAEPAEPDNTQIDVDNDFVTGDQAGADESAMPLGLAWWAWLLLALVAVALVAAIAVAMSGRDRTTIIDRDYGRLPPPP